MSLPDSPFRQILYNLLSLLSNGIEASPRGGVVKICAMATEETLEVTVSDQGPGIPPEAPIETFSPPLYM